MRGTTPLAVLALAAVLAAPAFACIWDDDTLLDERRGLPGVAEVIAGKWERHSPFFYEHRVKVMAARLEKDPNDLAAYDNLAVAYEKLGRPGDAIALMLKKEQVKPGEYTTHANLGTFYLHTGDLENGIAHIRKALEINPDAHFGREKYQLMAAEYLRRTKADPSELDLGSFVLPELFRATPEVREIAGKQGYADLITSRRNQMWHGRGSPSAETEKAIEGVVGMIRFGTGTSPHLYHALGDLLAQRGDRHLASRAYRRASQFNHPRPELLKEAIAAVEGAVEHKAELSDDVVAKEQADAEAWVKAYQQYEDDLVRGGHEPRAEADYAPFYAKYGSARPAPTRMAAAANDATKFVRRYGWVVAGMAALVVTLIVRASIKSRRRRRQAVAAAAG
jgi:tetratricopeptide (TPR) repeat protein